MLISHHLSFNNTILSHSRIPVSHILILMFRVYLGVHTQTHKKAAIKIIKTEAKTEWEIAILEKEVNFQIQLNHPNITKILDAGFVDFNSRYADGRVYHIALKVIKD